MIQLHPFVFNDFQENTYVLWDESGECLIIDPGCHYPHEKKELKDFIQYKKIRPVLLLNTHCHLDHVFGNKWVKETWEVPLQAHKADLFLLKAMTATAAFYGFSVEQSPEPDLFLEEGDEVKFGNSVFSILFTPGHSPGSICFLHSSPGDKTSFVVGGDVLFQGSIGRVDLPGGNYETLMQSICNKLLILPDDTLVYSGHGPVTTIGEEKRTNPFILEYLTEAKR